MPIVSELLPNHVDELLLEPRVGSMEIYQYERHFIQDHLPGVDASWYCGLFKVSCGGSNGWEEFRLASFDRFDLIRFASVFRQLKGLSVSEALEIVQTHGATWGSARQQLAEGALLSLSRQLLHPTPPRPSVPAGLSTSERALLFDCSQAYYSF